MKKYSISQLAKEFGLSRSTLLHYDSIGLLKPFERTLSNYRIYTDEEYKKLSKINSLRKTGISLEKVKEIIDSDDSKISEILHKRLSQINDEIKGLRLQQNTVISLLKNRGLLKSTRIITKETWVNILKSTGLDEDGMLKWHMEFESSAPEAHQDFLELLGLSLKEIKSIREMSKQDK